MKFTKEQILAIANNLPDSVEFPESWPVPEGNPNQWARVMSMDVSNRDSKNPSLRWNMERATNYADFSPQYRPDWAMETSAQEMYADPELAAWAYLNQISNYVMAATSWQRKLDFVPSVPPAPVEP